MIPKIIHYCWLGDKPYPEIVLSCFDSWKKIMPEYQYILWNTEKFNVSMCQYTEQAYQAEKYAYVSDYIRLYALYQYGGIYLDCDVEVLESFNDLLEAKAFTGFEKDRVIATWIIGSEKRNPIIKEFLDYYKDRNFVLKEGTYELIPNVYPFTDICRKHGLVLNNELQHLDFITIFPRTYFCPVHPEKGITDCYSKATHARHLFNASWLTSRQKELIKKKHEVEKKYGKFISLVFYAMGLIREEGFSSFYTQWKLYKRKKYKL